MARDRARNDSLGGGLPSPHVPQGKRYETPSPHHNVLHPRTQEPPTTHADARPGVQHVQLANTRRADGRAQQPRTQRPLPQGNLPQGGRPQGQRPSSARPQGARPSGPRPAGRRPAQNRRPAGKRSGNPPTGRRTRRPLRAGNSAQPGLMRLLPPALLVLVVVVALVLGIRACSAHAPAPAPEGSAATAGASKETGPSYEARTLEQEPVTNSQTVLQTNAYAHLTQAVGELEDKGHTVGIELYDLDTGALLSYNANEESYPASSIKGPYVTSLYAQLVDKGKLKSGSIYSAASSIILYSDNNVYADTRRAYGSEPFEAWLEQASVGSGAYDTLAEYSEPFYPTTCPAQMLGMWRHVYDYLTSGTAASSSLADLFATRDVSAMKDALGQKYITWGKAGWYPAGDGAYYKATVDAGVVWSQEGPYIAVVMTTMPDNMDGLEEIFVALDEVHDELVNPADASALVPDPLVSYEGEPVGGTLLAQDLQA